MHLEPASLIMLKVTGMVSGKYGVEVIHYMVPPLGEYDLLHQVFNAKVWVKTKYLKK